MHVISVAVFCCAVSFATAGVWPKPQQYAETSKVLTVDPSHFKFSGNFQECPIVKKAVERYGGIIFLTKRGSSAFKPSEQSAPQAPESFDLNLSTLKIELVDDGKNGGPKFCEEWPSEGMDEKCKCLTFLSHIFTEQFTPIPVFRK